MKQYFIDAALMLRDAVLSKKFIGVVAASYFLHEDYISGGEWVTVMMVYLGANVAEKTIGVFKKSSPPPREGE